MEPHGDECATYTHPAVVSQLQYYQAQVSPSYVDPSTATSVAELQAVRQLTCFIQVENGLWLVAHDETIRGDLNNRSTWELTFADNGALLLKEISGTWLREDGYGGLMVVSQARATTHGVIGSEYWVLNYAGQAGKFMLSSMAGRFLYVPFDGPACVADSTTVSFSLDAVTLRFYIATATPAISQPIMFYTAPNPTLFQHTITSAAGMPHPESLPHSQSDSALLSHTQRASAPPPLAPRPQLQATVHRPAAPKAVSLTSSTSLPQPVLATVPSASAVMPLPPMRATRSPPLSSSSATSDAAPAVPPRRSTVASGATHSSMSTQPLSQSLPQSHSPSPRSSNPSPNLSPLPSPAPPSSPASAASAAAMPTPPAPTPKGGSARSSHTTLLHTQHSSPAILAHTHATHPQETFSSLYYHTTSTAAPATPSHALLPLPPLASVPTSASVRPLPMKRPTAPAVVSNVRGQSNRDTLAPLREFSSHSYVSSRLALPADAPAPPPALVFPPSAALPSPPSSTIPTAHSQPQLAGAASAPKPPRPSTPAPSPSPNVNHNPNPLSLSSSRPLPNAPSLTASSIAPLKPRTSSYAPFVDYDTAGQGANMNVGNNRVPMGRYVDEKDPSYPLVCALLLGFDVVNRSKIAILPEILTPENASAERITHFNKDGQTIKRNFDFVEHAPEIFALLRRRYGPSFTNYETSFAKSFYELGSPGKSRSQFFISLNGCYIIKTLYPQEFEFLRSLLLVYYQHMVRSPNSLLNRYLALFTIRFLDQSSGGGEITISEHFIVMENLFPPDRDVSEIYDLKGSTDGRAATPEERRKRMVVLKDLDFHRKLELGPHVRTAFLEQVAEDTAFLERWNVMDYSLLVLVCKSERSARKIPGVISVFKSDEGGVYGQNIEGAPNGELYYIGVIDLLQPYDITKIMENMLKTGFKLYKQEDGISCVPAEKYRARFRKYVDSITT